MEKIRERAKKERERQTDRQRDTHTYVRASLCTYTSGPVLIVGKHLLVVIEAPHPNELETSAALKGLRRCRALIAVPEKKKKKTIVTLRRPGTTHATINIFFLCLSVTIALNLPDNLREVIGYSPHRRILLPAPRSPRGLGRGGGCCVVINLRLAVKEV